MDLWSCQISSQHNIIISWKSEETSAKLIDNAIWRVPPSHWPWCKGQTVGRSTHIHTNKLVVRHHSNYRQGFISPEWLSVPGSSMFCCYCIIQGHHKTFNFSVRSSKYGFKNCSSLGFSFTEKEEGWILCHARELRKTPSVQFLLSKNNFEMKLK